MAVSMAETLWLMLGSAWTEEEEESMRVEFESLLRDEARARELGMFSVGDGRWAVGGRLGPVLL